MSVKIIITETKKTEIELDQDEPLPEPVLEQASYSYHRSKYPYTFPTKILGEVIDIKA